MYTIVKKDMALVTFLAGANEGNLDIEGNVFV